MEIESNTKESSYRGAEFHTAGVRFSLLCVSSAKVYIDKKMKRNSIRAPDDLIGDILHHSSLSKKELYAAITELQIGGVETVSKFYPATNVFLTRALWKFNA